MYIQIEERLRNEILSGEYSPGDQIPPVRQLAITAAVNPNTVQRALTELENEGILCARGTLGRFVTEDTTVLEAARKRAAKGLIKSFLMAAEDLSISKQEIINMLKEDNV